MTCIATDPAATMAAINPNKQSALSQKDPGILRLRLCLLGLTIPSSEPFVPHNVLNRTGPRDLRNPHLERRDPVEP
jgi:hypothetical protein